MKTKKETSTRIKLYVPKEAAKVGTELCEKLWSEEGISVGMTIDDGERITRFFLQDIKDKDTANWYVKFEDAQRIFIWEEKKNQVSFSAPEDFLKQIQRGRDQWMAH